MLIINHKKKDFYDGVVGTTGIDKTIVYDRQIIEVEENNIPKIFQRKTGYWGLRYRENSFHSLNYYPIKKEYQKFYDKQAYFIVGFCGKLYIGWKLYHVKTEYPHEIITTIKYDNKYIKTILEPKSWHGILEDNINNILTFDALQLFRDFNTPVFIYDSDYNRSFLDSNHGSNNPKFFINPLLKDYEFYKVFDTFQAFQEIQMFLSGVLGNKEKEIVEVADKYKIQQHGFDYKWSFRKESEKK